MRSLQQQGDNALAAVLALANAAPDAAAGGEAVYFDLFTRVLVRYPQSWAWPASAITLLLIVIAGVRLLRLGRLNWRSLAAGVAGLAAALLLGVVASVALMAALRALGALDSGGAAATVAHPWALQLSFVALALTVTSLTGAWLARRAGFWGLWYAGSLLCALLGLPLARWLPGASYLTLLPALASLVALLPALGRGDGDGHPDGHGDHHGAAGWPTATELAAPVSCALTLVLLLPIALPLFGALGANGLPALTLLLIYGGFGVSALVANSQPPLPRRLIVACALGLLIGIATAALLPRYSDESPQRLNLIYQLDTDAGQAVWIAESLSSAAPASLLRSAAFARGAAPASSWRRQAWMAPAATLPLAPPQLTLLGKERGAGARVQYRVRVATLRGAPLLILQFPPAAQVRSVSVEGVTPQELSVTPRQLNHGWSQLRLTSVPAQGLQLTLDAGASAFELRLLDESFGLPPAGSVLARARPESAVPWQDGDVTTVTRAYRLQP